MLLTACVRKKLYPAKATEILEKCPSQTMREASQRELGFENAHQTDGTQMAHLLHEGDAWCGVSHGARPGAHRGNINLSLGHQAVGMHSISWSELSPPEGRAPCQLLQVGQTGAPIHRLFFLAAFLRLQVLEALPWEPAVVLKWAAQGGVAVLFSPVADRLVVSPAIHQWVQAKLRSLSS